MSSAQWIVFLALMAALALMALVANDDDDNFV
jgi:hypothetical protein